MVAADRASRPPLVQPLSAQLASVNPQEDRIAAAFGLFWTRWQAILAQNQAATAVPQLPATSPARVPALKRIATPPTNTKLQKVTKALPRLKGSRPSTRYCKPESRQARRATKRSPPLHKLKWRTQGAYTRPTPGEVKKACQHSTQVQRYTAANSTLKGFTSTSRGHTESHTRQTAWGAEKLSHHKAYTPTTQGTHTGPGGNGGVPLASMIGDAKAPWDFPVCALQVPTTGVG
ncbi:Hypothetical predicted protein [Pelobates cultripes]|uniref:Uncharacterized protein n=1 Tax=Pelobates cultripes TaxID=61616 RepID=A0AAD1R689_PELCU|nr:Hypothetical predicted protein [Pelobates cultripes]